MKMNAAKSLFLAGSIIAASAMLTAAQVIIELKPKAAEQPTAASAEQDPNDLVNEVFSPITGALNLTPNQKFRIANIAAATMLTAEPLFQQLDDLGRSAFRSGLHGAIGRSQNQTAFRKTGGLA
jgi:hypothetical protein